MVATVLSSAIVVGLAGASPARAEYALLSGDRVVFLGDGNASIQLVSGDRGSGGDSYVEQVEDYTLLRFPERSVTFANVFREGATAADLVPLLGRALDGDKATVLIVVVGMNDLVSGPTSPVPTPEIFAQRKDAYLAAIGRIVDAAVARGIRVFVCSYPVTSTDPRTVYGDAALHDLLEQLGEAGIEAAESRGGAGIRLTAATRAIAARARQQGLDLSFNPPPFPGDGLHLNPLGHLAAAYALMKGLGAPSEISSVSLSVSPPAVEASDGATVSDLSWDPDPVRLSFTRIDRGLPFAHPIYGDAYPGIVGFDQDINRYMLEVTGLPTGCYDTSAEGVGSRRFSAARLAAGVNLANWRSQSPGGIPRIGGPWDARALQLAQVTRGRGLAGEVLLQLYGWLPGRDPSVIGNGNNRALEKDTRKAQRLLARLQREIARPRPFRFVVEKATFLPNLC